MKRQKILLMVLALTLALATSAFAQFGEGGGRGHRGMGGPPDMDNENRIENIENLKMLKLMEALELTDKQTEKYIALLYDHRKTIKDLRVERRAIADSLSNMLDQPNQDKNILRLVDRLKDNMDNQMNSMSQLFDKSKAILTPYQMGKQALFMEHFERDMLKSLREFRGRDQMPPDPSAGDGK